MSTADLPPEILALNVEDRIHLAMNIWDSVAEESISVSEENQRILEERLREHKADPFEGTPWQEAVAKLRCRP
jgi:putative addiction module component (TIGR02574 family)